jgi:heme o synthase
MSSVAGTRHIALPASSWVTKAGAYIALTKPRIIELLLITTVPTMIVAQRGLPSLWLVAATVIGGTLAAGGANAVNMWWDRDIDAVMKRTSRRPLVQGTITARAALTFAIALHFVAFAWLWAFVNLLSASLALAASLFYVFVYTLWLKRSSSSNIVIGGAAGAMPVLVGWAAVTNSVGLAPLVMFAIIFVWTPPHFWALAFKYRNDYKSVDVPMLPAVASLSYTAKQILAYTVALWALAIVLAPIAHLGLVYWVIAVATGAIFTAYAVKLKRDHTEQTAMKLFHWSISYLTLLFCGMALDQFLHFT